MAKISKKPPRVLPKVEIDQINQFIFEGIEDPSAYIAAEPMTHLPNVDMFSTQKEIIVEVELPGVKKDDVEVTISKNTLVIKAIKVECFEEEKINYVCMERSFGRLFRTIDLPCPVDTTKVKAAYKDGILIISIPKVEDKRCASTKIDIESE